MARVASFVFLSLASAISLINCSTGWMVECFERNPYWCLYNMSFSSRKPTNLLHASFSRTLEIAGSMLIGL